MKTILIILLLAVSTNIYSANKTGKSGKGYRESYGENLNEYSLMNIDNVIQIYTDQTNCQNQILFEVLDSKIDNHNLNIYIKSNQNSCYDFTQLELPTDRNYNVEYSRPFLPPIAFGHFNDLDLNSNVIVGINIKDIRRNLLLTSNLPITYSIKSFSENSIFKLLKLTFKLDRNGTIKLKLNEDLMFNN